MAKTWPTTSGYKSISIGDCNDKKVKKKKKGKVWMGISKVYLLGP